MPRIIKSSTGVLIGVDIVSVHGDASQSKKSFRVGDTIENLRYVVDGEIITVSGRLSAINYSVPARSSWSRINPTKDTLSSDVTIDSIVLDNSEQYHSSLVSINAADILEWEGEADVDSVVLIPLFFVNLSFNYSDRTTNVSDITIGDRYNNVKIYNESTKSYITGVFTVMAFTYSISNSKVLSLTGIVFKDDEGNVIIADFGSIHYLNEVYTHSPSTALDAISMVSTLADGDTLKIDTDIDNSSSVGSITISDKKDVQVVMNADFNTASSASSNFVITNSSVTLSGTGKFKTSTPYDSTHSTTVVKINSGSSVVFDGVGCDTALEDPDKGQFGIGVFGDAKVTVNKGDFKAGWYAFSENGTQSGSEITINDGKFTSVGDYTLYFPANATRTINGGEFTGAAGAIAMNNGTLNITGGTFIGGSGSLTTTVYSSDGTYTLENSTATINVNAKYGDCVVRISGGTFIASTDTIVAASTSLHNIDIKVSGGFFSEKFDPSFLEEGYIFTAEKNADGYYEVVKALLDD